MCSGNYISHNYHFLILIHLYSAKTRVNNNAILYYRIALKNVRK